jgi:hypothetical protein
MADEKTRTIHFHIGPDGVFEDLFRLVFEQSSDELNYAYVSDEDYREHLRDFVNEGDAERTLSALRDLHIEAETIAMSRPRLLFKGGPMNLKRGGSLYRLDAIQKGFKDYRIVFHLFLTDHLGYLLRLPRPAMFLKSGVQLSWRPLVKSVSARVTRGNELMIWRAEGKGFVEAFLSATLGSSNRRLDALIASVLSAEKVPQPEAEEQFAAKMGLDMVTLDADFEKEMFMILPGSLL